MKKNKTIFLLVLFSIVMLSFTQAFAQTNTWDGSSSNNWNTGANWSLGHVPLSTEDVVIPNGVSGSNDNPSVNTTAVCASLTINSGNVSITLSFSGSNTLTVGGAVTINAGSSSDKTISVGGGTLSCASITMANTGDNSDDVRLTISTGTVTATGNITMNGSSNRNAISFSGVGTLYVGGNISGGTIDASGGDNGTVNLNGSGAQSIAGYTFHHLTINKSAEDVTLTGSATVNGTLTFTSGNLYTSTFTLILGGSITGETTDRYLHGTLQTSRYVSSSSSTMNGIGVSIAAGTSYLGTTTVIRKSGTGSHVSANGNESIDRTWEIYSSNSNTRTITFYFILPDEQNSVALDQHGQTFYSTNGTVWSTVGVEHDASGGSIEATGVALSSTHKTFTVADGSNPLPVELSSFSAAVNNNVVVLSWITATEKNNYGFDVEKKVGDNWNRIGFVQGSGNSNSPKNYSFTDKAVNGSYSYRLKQVNTDGTYVYSDPVEVEVNAMPKKYALGNYPNPFNPSTIIQFEIPQASHVNLSIYNIVGEKVATLVNEVMDAGVYQRTFASNSYNGQLSSGIYFYRLATDNGINITKKMILAK